MSGNFLLRLEHHPLVPTMTYQVYVHGAWTSLTHFLLFSPHSLCSSPLDLFVIPSKAMLVPEIFFRHILIWWTFSSFSLHLKLPPKKGLLWPLCLKLLPPYLCPYLPTHPLCCTLFNFIIALPAIWSSYCPFLLSVSVHGHFLSSLSGMQVGCEFILSTSVYSLSE